MLRFTVFDEAIDISEQSVQQAYLLGPDDRPIAGTISRDGREIVCRKKDSDAAALCLQFDAGPMGRLLLQTCLLPDRKRPFLLTVELARHRIKQYLAKCEEWQLFDLAEEQPAVRLWKRASREFSEAFKHHEPAKAEQAGLQSLLHAIDATEHLAQTHAEVLLQRRYGNRPASSTTLGVRVWPGRNAPALQDILAKDFDVLSLPVIWRELEVEEGTYNWAPLDQWMSWAQSQGKPVVAGPLLDFSHAALPPWMHVWEHDYDTTRDLAYDHICRVVERYQPVVSIWNIAAGLNINENFAFTLDQAIDLTRMTSLVVKQVRRNARTMVELSQPFGAHTASRAGSTRPLAYLNRVIEEGIKLDCIGVQLLFGQADRGRSTRDLMQISSFLDRFVLLERPVMVTAMGVPCETDDDSGTSGGTWRDDWSKKTQAKWATRVAAIALSKPYVEAIIWADLFDYNEMTLPASGLIDRDGRAKPVLQHLVAMRRRLRKPLGRSRATAQVSDEI